MNDRERLDIIHLAGYLAANRNGTINKLYAKMDHTRIANLLYRLATRPNFEELMYHLDHLTEPPEDGDHDQHVRDAIEETFKLMEIK
jgi:hypothetical protein